MNKVFLFNFIVVLMILIKMNVGFSAIYKVSVIDGVQFITVTEEITDYEAQNIFYIRNDINVYLPTVVHFNSPGGSLLGLSTVKSIFLDIQHDIRNHSRVPVYGYVGIGCNSACIPAFLYFKPNLFAMGEATFGFHAASGGLYPEIHNESMISELTESSGYTWMNRYRYIFDTTDVTYFTANELMRDQFRAFISPHPKKEPIILSRFSQVTDEMLKKTKQSISCYKKKKGILWEDYGQVNTKVKPGESSVMLRDGTSKTIRGAKTTFIPSGYVEVELLNNEPYKPERGYVESAYYKIRLRRVVPQLANQIPDYEIKPIQKLIDNKNDFWVSAADIYCGKE